MINNKSVNSPFKRCSKRNFISDNIYTGNLRLVIYNHQAHTLQSNEFICSMLMRFFFCLTHYIEGVAFDSSSEIFFLNK